MLWKNTVAPELLDVLINMQGNEIFKDFILAGGTALSLQIGHRESKDIDLFTTGKLDNAKCIRYFKETYNNVDVINDKENILQIMIGQLKVDMVSVKGIMIEPPRIEENLKMFGIKDIAGMKLLAIQQRKQAKDYIDIAYLLQEMSLEDMFDTYKIKNNTDNVYNAKCGLLDVNRVNPYTWANIKMFRNDILISEIPRIFEIEIKKYNEKHGIGKKNFFGFLKKRG